jgi:4-hydroxy-tetrahydrodipicolinate reductase
MSIKAGLLGYGKMGQAIDQLAEQFQVEIVWRISSTTRGELSPERLREADVVIEFTRPEAGFEHVKACLEAGVPVVSGTTGWQAKLPEAEALCRQKEGAFLWASNFSVGVNLFFAVNEYLSMWMQRREEYQPHITEIHHIHKLDAPSGTAVSIAEGILQAGERFKGWALDQNIDPTFIPIQAVREGEVPGTHRVQWTGVVDEITIEHKAYSRAGFAAGALVAANWIVGKKGVFTMRNVLFGL